MADWAARALTALHAGEPCALVSVLAVEGSTPREAGVRMTVTRDDACGSVGGGNLEFQAIAQARAALDQPAGAWRIQDYPLGPLLAQCCGGRVRLMVEHLDAGAVDWLVQAQGRAAFGLETRLFAGRAERHLIDVAADTISARGPMPVTGDVFSERVGAALTPVLMFGAGHVGAAVARVLKPLPFALDWMDTRDEATGLDGVTVADVASLIAAARDAKGLVLVLTHDHQLDYDLCVAALGGLTPFIGLIGSATKRARFLSRLAKDGFGPDQTARLHCPVGLEGLRGKAPEIIAVSVAAQLLMHQTRSTP